VLAPRLFCATVRHASESERLLLRVLKSGIELPNYSREKEDKIRKNKKMGIVYVPAN
jgi:hypothetical protein